MKKEIKEEWLRRLRGGEYQQGKTYLKHDGKYCCIGVLCDIVNAWDITSHYHYYKDDCVLFDVTTTVVNDRLGLSGTNQDVLVEMNDGGKTFSEIADWIEKFVENN